jgi:hypothetical protein
MQSIQEMTETWVAAGTKKGLKLPTRTNESEELFLSKIKLICEASGVEIRESRRVERKNGSAINEAVSEDRVQRAMRLHKMNFREATIFTGGVDPGPRAKTPAAFTESLVKAWKDYCGGLISEADCQTLASKGISPE